MHSGGDGRGVSRAALAGRGEAPVTPRRGMSGRRSEAPSSQGAAPRAARRTVGWGCAFVPSRPTLEARLAAQGRKASRGRAWCCPARRLRALRCGSG